MPGFNIGSSNTSEPANQSEINRVHRWRITNLGNAIPPRQLVYAKTLQLPGWSVEEEIVIGASIKYKFAKTVNWEDVSISFYDVSGIYQGLLDWQDSVYTPDGGIRPADGYKRDCGFMLTDGAGQQAGPTYTLKNSWPKNISHSALTYDSSELKLINITLSYDWALIGNGSGVAT